VERAERLPLAKGAACTVRAKLRHTTYFGGDDDRGHVESLVVQCGDFVAYRFEGDGSHLARVSERPGERSDTFRHEISFSDSRDPELDLDTGQRKIVIKQNRAPAFRLELAVEELGAEVPGPPFHSKSAGKTVGLRPSRRHAGRVIAVSGAAPTQPGARCELVERTSWVSKYGNCIVEMTCGGAVLHSNVEKCPETGPLKFTRMDDPRVEVDLATGKAVVTSPEGKAWSVVMQY
jgi:hypothetical protein